MEGLGGYQGVIGHGSPSQLNLKETERWRKVLPGPTALNTHMVQTDKQTWTHTVRSHTHMQPLYFGQYTPVDQMMTQCFNSICRGLMPREEFPHYRLLERKKRDGVGVIVTDEQKERVKKRGGERETSESKVLLLNHDDCFTANSLLFLAVKRDGLIILLCITGTHSGRLLAAFMKKG